MLRDRQRNGTKSSRSTALPQCASYRERQSDDWIKKMETVPEGFSDYLTHDRADMGSLLAKCVLAESVL